MKRALLVTMMSLGLVAGGCAVDSHPKDVGYFSTNRAATSEVTEYSGDYVLYGDDDATKTGPVLMRAHLKVGEVVGFSVDESKVPYAIAGDQRIKLASGRFRWEMTPDKGQVDWNKTNVLTVEIVVTVVVVVIAVVSTLAATGGL